MQEKKSGLVPNSFIEQIIEKADIFTYINQTVTLKAINHNSSKGLCPFHNEKTPSFHVHRDKQYFHCFGCGEHGNVINFLMKIKNLTFPDTIKQLAEDLNLEIPNKQDQHNPQYKQAYELLKSAQEKFRQNLTKNKAALDYLVTRGLSKSTIDFFGIGYSCELAIEQNNRDLAKEIGLINMSNRSYFFNRITFPIYNTVGKIVGFGGRVLDNSMPKYLNSKESIIFHKSKTLYGLYQAKQVKQDYVIVVEGYMDVVALHEHGIKNAVASLGTAINSNHINLLFKHFDKIAFCFDGDGAGQAAAWKTLKQTLPLLGDGKDIKFIIMPKGEDPDSLIKSRGKQAWVEACKQSLGFDKFFFSYLKKELKLNNGQLSIADKSNYGKTAIGLISQMPNSIGKQLMFKSLEEIVETAVNPVSKNTTTENKTNNKAELNHIQQAIKIIIHNPHMAKNLTLQEEITNSESELCKLLCDVVKLSVDCEFKSLASLLLGTKEHMLSNVINKYAAMPFDNIEQKHTKIAFSTATLKACMEIVSNKIDYIIKDESCSERKVLKQLLQRKSQIMQMLNQLRENSNGRF